jgi:aryl-alcohol dehydrogenase-like predicted oxidoreductase
MEVRVLGSTGLRVSPIGLGLAALGRPAYITLGRAADLGADRSVTALERRSHEMLDAAYAAGIRYFDTARSYGLAEQFLASWLDTHTPADVTVGSKWGYTYTAGWQLDARTQEEKDLSVAMLIRQFGESRARLGSHLHLYQIHSATVESGVLEDRHVLAQLMRVRSEGVSVGLSVSGPRQADAIRRALEASVDGVNPFQSVQATWNLLEPSAGAALAEARARGWGVIVKEVVANGRLTDQHAADHAQALIGAAKVRHTTVDALAIAAALSQPWAHVVLSGAVTTAQLHSHLSALALSDVGLDLPSIAEPPATYWQRRATLPWH